MILITKNDEIGILFEILYKDPKSIHLIMKRLRDLGTKAHDSIPKLISILKAENEESNGITIVQTIADILADKSLDYLIEILQNKSLIYPARYTAAQILGSFEEKAEKAVEPLIEELKNIKNNHFLRCDSAYALGRIGEKLFSNKKEEKTNFLISTLFDSFMGEKDEDVKTNIAMAIREISKQKEGANLIKNRISILIEKEKKSNPLYYLNEAREKCKYWFKE